MSLDVAEYLDIYSKTHSYEGPEGIIVWRRGTGNNVELLYVRASVERKGYGKTLLRRMLLALKTNPPYATVFGFTRTCNEVAKLFYAECGFELTTVKGVYKDGEAVLFSAEYSTLRRNLLNEQN